MKKMTVVKIGCFALLACVTALSPATAQTQKTKSTAKKTAKSAGIVSTMTVSKMAPPSPGSDYYEVMFLSWEQVFKLSKKANPEYLKRLKESMEKHKPVYIMRANEQSFIIQKVIMAGTPDGQKKKK